MEKEITKDKLKEDIAKFFNVPVFRKGNISVTCPLHNDTRSSASLNLQKGVFQCFSGCGGYSFRKLAIRLLDIKNIDKNITETVLGKEKMNKKKPRKRIIQANKKTFQDFLNERKIAPSTYKDLGAKPDFDANNDTYGYLVFPSNNGENKFVARSFTNREPKYLNAAGDKVLFNYDKSCEDVFLVEGIFDLCSLYELGFKNVVCGLGSVLTKQQAYLLRKKTVFILFDSDYAGWHGSIEVSKLLSEVGANPIILELPEFRKKDGFLGKDVNELFIVDKKQLQDFVEKTVNKYNTTDEAYVHKLFTGKDVPLKIFPCGIKSIDEMHDGGHTEGMHGYVGEPAQGKTALQLALSKGFAENEARVLVCSYEISIRQNWARVASMFSKYEWRVLERYPEKLEPKAKEKIDELAKKIKIVAGWHISEIKRVAKNYDVIVIDYIQRMPGPTEDTTTNVNMNLGGLSDLARDDAKVVIILSSLPISAYGNSNSPRLGKDSGNIEFQVQTGTRLTRIDKNTINLNMIKNTRGITHNINIRANLANLKFK